jgi:hypothetical protein
MPKMDSLVQSLPIIPFQVYWYYLASIVGLCLVDHTWIIKVQLFKQAKEIV